MKKLLIFLALIIPLNVCAESILHITPEWKGATNKDGTGLYNEIIINAFKMQGIEVNRQFAPFNRCVLNVKKGKADITGGVNKEDEWAEGVLFSQHQCFESNVVAMYRKSLGIRWTGVESIKGFRSLSTFDTMPERFLKQHNDIFGNEKLDKIKNIEMILKMFLKGRAEFVLLYDAAIDIAIKTLKEKKEPLMSKYYPEELERKPIFIRKVYFVFTDNNKGKRLRDVYDASIVAMLKNGKLKALYKKYNFPFPATLEVK